MKIRLEISPDAEEELVIRAPCLTDRLTRLQKDLEGTLLGEELPLTMDKTVFFVPIRDILFFETEGERVAAHTKDAAYTAAGTLCLLEQRLPRSFVRVSKSCLLNYTSVCALSRGVTGTAEARFAGTDKVAYVSRHYFANLQTLIYETRIRK